MGYIEAKDLRQAIGFQAAAMMAGFTDTDTQTQAEQFDAMLDGIIEQTSDLINAMVGTRYDVSGLSGNPILARICLMISRYDVYCQFARFDVPETVRLAYEAAMKDLEKIQAGKLELLPDDTEFDPEDVVAAQFTSKSQYLTEML